MKNAYLSILMASVLVSLNSANAIDRYATVSNPLASPGDAVVVSAGDRFMVSFDLNRSYSCEIFSQDPLSELGLDLNALNPLGTSVALTARGDTTPQISVPDETDTSQADNRVAIFATVAGNWTFNVASAKEGGENAIFRCYESTLYASWNTTLSPLNFLEIVNISSEDIQIIWIARDYSGVTYSDTEIVPANRRLDIDLHSVVGSPNFGDIKIKTDGPIGAIRGAVSMYQAGVDGKPELSQTLKLERRDY